MIRLSCIGRIGNRGRTVQLRGREFLHWNRLLKGEADDRELLLSLNLEVMLPELNDHGNLCKNCDVSFSAGVA